MARMGLPLQAWHWSTRKAASVRGCRRRGAGAGPSRSGRAVL